MLLCVILYIMLAYLMLFAALSNAICLHNAFFFAIDFLQMLFVFVLCLGLLAHSLFISLFIIIYRYILVLVFIIYSAINLSVFEILCSHRFFIKGLCVLWKTNT